MSALCNYRTGTTILILAALFFLLTGCGGDDNAGTGTGTANTATTSPRELTGSFTLLLISADAAGVPADGSSGGTSISGDGAFVSFASDAANLVPADANGAYDIFRKDAASGDIILVSTDSNGAQADGDSGTSSTSGDGRYVAFWSEAANLVPGDGNGLKDVFVKDSMTGTTALVSARADGAPGNSGSDLPSISDDGRYVAFRSTADDLIAGDTNGALDVFVRDTLTGVTALASAGEDGTPGDGPSCDTYPPSISADGRYVAFESAAANLVPGDANGKRDIFVKDMQTGEIRLASSDTAGNPGDGGSLYATISDDGRRVLFRSIAGNLVPGDSRICDGVNCSDVFLKDLDTGSIIKVSTDAAGGDADAPAWDPDLSGDGRYAAFSSAASNLVPDDTNGTYDIFVKDVETGAVLLISKNAEGRSGNGWSIGPYLSADGLAIAFQSEAADLVPGDANAAADVLLAVGAWPAPGR